MKPIAWYDPTNGAVSTDKDSPLFTPLGQVLPLYTKQEDDGITLTTIRHPRGKPALGDLNPESLEQVEIDLPEPVACKECHLKDLVYDLLGELKVANLKLSVRAKRTWVGLTYEEQRELYKKHEMDGWGHFYNAIEAKLKEKNVQR